VVEPTRQELRKLSPHRRQRWSVLDQWDRATPAVDCVLLTVDDRQLKVLVHRRPKKTDDAEAGRWALPGVLLNYGERYEDAVERALKSKGHVGPPSTGFQQVESWNYPERDKRGWVITVVFLAICPVGDLRRQLPTNTVSHALGTVEEVESEWASVVVAGAEPENLAFDHNQLIAHAVRKLRQQIPKSPKLLDLLPETFTLRELQEAYEAVIGRSVNTDSFRRSVTRFAKIVEPTGTYRATFGRKAAELYRRRAT
jgi:8-oxo-dGTP diphosphatase